MGGSLPLPTIKSCELRQSQSMRKHALGLGDFSIFSYSEDLMLSAFKLCIECGFV